MVRQLFGSRWLTRRSSNRRRRRESTIAARGGSLGAVAYAGASFEPLEGRAMLAVMISQYVETNSGSVPKGIEVWNPTAPRLISRAQTWRSGRALMAPRHKATSFFRAARWPPAMSG